MVYLCDVDAENLDCDSFAAGFWPLINWCYCADCECCAPGWHYWIFSVIVPIRILSIPSRCRRDYFLVRFESDSEMDLGAHCSVMGILGQCPFCGWSCADQ